MLKKVFFRDFQQGAFRLRRGARVKVFQHHLTKAEQLSRVHHHVQVPGLMAVRVFDLNNHLPFQNTVYPPRGASGLIDPLPFPVIALATVASKATQLLLGAASEKWNRFQILPINHKRSLREQQGRSFLPSPAGALPTLYLSTELLLQLWI